MAVKKKKQKFSPTRIAAYLTCRMMYRLEFVDKVGHHFLGSAADMSLGATLHQALYTFHSAGGTQALDSDALVYEAGAVWRSFGYRSDAQERDYRAMAAVMLRRYHETETVRDGERRLFLAEKNLSLDLGLFTLTGRVDRIDEHLPGGELEIVDYKSGRDTVTEEDVKGAIAMTVYQVMARRAWPDRRVLATIHALRGGESATVELTDAEIDEWEDALRGIGREMIETDYESLRPSYLPDVCPTCGFYRRCCRPWLTRRAVEEEWD